MHPNTKSWLGVWYQHVSGMYVEYPVPSRDNANHLILLLSTCLHPASNELLRLLDEEIGDN